MSTTANIKAEIYIDSTSTGDTANLNPEDTTDVGLNEGISVKQNGGGITFEGAGNVKGGKTGYDAGIGFWMGFDEAARKYRTAIGDPSNEKITWDGTDLAIDIDGSNLTVNGGATGQGLSVASDGTVTFVDLVDVLNDLSNVNASSPSTNDALIYDGTNWVPGSVTVGSLNDLGDVSITSVATDNILQYNGTNWVNVTPATLAGDINLGDLGDVTGTTHTAGTFKVLIPKTGNVYGFEDLRSVTSSYVRLRDLENVTNTSATTTGLLLQYNHSNQLWEYETPAGMAQSYINLNGLKDVGPTNGDLVPSDGQILRWSTASSPARYTAVTPGNLAGDMNIGELNDVSFTGVTLLNNMVLKYNGSNWTAGSATVSVSGLSDTSISSLSNGQILQYNSSTGDWENADPAGSGVTSITISAGTGLAGGGTITSSGTVGLSVDLSELTDMTEAVNSAEDELIILDNGADKRKLISEIPLSAFDNDLAASPDTLGDLSNVNTAVDGTAPTTPQFTSNALPVLARNGTNWDITVLEIDDLYGIATPGSNSVGKILEVGTQDTHPEQFAWKSYKASGTRAATFRTNTIGGAAATGRRTAGSTADAVQYQRVGDLVHVHIHIVATGGWDSSITSYASEDLWLECFPYEVAFPNTPIIPIFIRDMTNLGSYYQGGAFLEHGTRNSLDAVSVALIDSSGTKDYMTVGQLNATSGEITASFTYITDESF